MNNQLQTYGYYGVLGVVPDAGIQDIKSAYRRLAHKYHPDVSNDPNGEESFKMVSEAYKTLKDREKRAAYDQRALHGNAAVEWLMSINLMWCAVIQWNMYWSSMAFHGSNWPRDGKSAGGCALQVYDSHNQGRRPRER